MIPKAAIEKAIEGGWLKTPYQRQVARGTRDEGWTFRYFIPTKKGDSTFPSDSYLADYEIICNPAFWQASGKAFGWDVLMMYYRCPADECDNMTEWSVRRFCPECGTRLEEWPTVTKNWQKYALRFYDLILTGQDTAAFWDELLINNK